MSNYVKVLLALALAAPRVFSQSSPAPADSLRPGGAIVRAEEIRTAVEHGGAGAMSDMVLRVVPINSSYNVGVSVVRRSQVDGKTPPDAIVHDVITEVYQITEGRGILVTGGSIESPTPLPADDPDVRQQIGPSSVGKFIRGGLEQSVGPGDVVVIPAGTPHGFSEISTPRIVYTLIRISPKRVLEPRGEAK